ncbi:MAG: hypothetical protein ACRDNS_09060, partial [Trebonia sp.]
MPDVRRHATRMRSSRRLWPVLLAAVALAGCGSAKPVTRTTTKTTTVTTSRTHVRYRQTRTIRRTRTITDRLPAVTRTVTRAVTQTTTITRASAGPTVEGTGSSSHATDAQFCATHDCIESFSDGHGTIVQCTDGEWSHSGG